MALERAANNIKMTHPPCLFWLLIYDTGATTFHYLFMREIT